MKNKKILLLLLVLLFVVSFSTVAYADWKCKYCKQTVKDPYDLQGKPCVNNRAYHVMEDQSSGCNVGAGFAGFGALGAAGLFMLKKRSV